MCKRIRNNGICVYGVFEIKGDLAVVRHYVTKNVTSYEYQKLVEALACFQMIKMELHVGLTRVEIEGDTLSVIRKLQSKGIDRSVIGAHILNIRAICERYQVCVFKHTLRQANEVAHLLVVEGLKRNEEIYLIGEVPSYAKEVAKEEIPT
ncbi:hypothetical protein Gotur_000746 [Gossypium turneri]